MEALKATDFFMPFILLLLWYLFGMYSDTANNHGRWVAFLLPLAPFVFIILYTLLVISKLMIYPFFVIFGKKEKYKDSSLNHCDLDGADHLEKENLSDWGNEMMKLNKSYGIKILGGCCGTGEDHLNYILNRYTRLTHKHYRGSGG